MCHSQPPRIPEEVARTLLPTAKKLLSEQAVDVSRQKRWHVKVSRCWKINCLGKQRRGHSFFATFTMSGFGWYLILRGTCADRLHRHASIVLCRKAGRYLFGSDRARSFDHYLLISSVLFFIIPFHVFARFIQKSSFFIICSPISHGVFPAMHSPKTQGETKCHGRLRDLGFPSASWWLWRSGDVKMKEKR